MSEGQTLKNFIDNQKLTKVKIAKDLGISKQTLFQYFKSQYLEPETKKRFEDYFGVSIFTDRATMAAIIAATGGNEQMLNDPITREEAPKSSLDRSIENLTQNELRTTAIIESLVELLKIQYKIDPRFVPPGTPETETKIPDRYKKTSSKAG